MVLTGSHRWAVRNVEEDVITTAYSLLYPDYHASGWRNAAEVHKKGN